MNRYRSPLLKRVPDTTNRNAWLHVSARTVILGGAAFILLACWVLYAFQPLARRGVAFGLYAFHDHVLLPLKGYLWTLFFPYSLVVWGSLAVLGFLALVSVLSDGALLRAAHLGLARAVVRMRPAHTVIVAAARMLLLAGFRPSLLQRVVEAEQVLAEQRLLAGASPPAQLIALTRLRIALVQVVGPRNKAEETALEGLAWWALTDVWLLLHARPGQGAARDWREHAAVLHDLSRQLPAAGAIASLFHPAGLAAELATLVDLQHRALPPEAPSSIKRGFKLALAVEGRARQLDSVREWIENRMTTGVEIVGDIGAMRDLALGLPLSWLPFVGCLNLAVATRLAWWLALPQVALASIESVEALTLALELADVKAGSEAALVVAGYNRLIETLPQPQHYQLCSQLAERQRLAQQAEWERLPGGSAASLQPADLDLARARTRVLAWAAGNGLALPNSND